MLTTNLKHFLTNLRQLIIFVVSPELEVGVAQLVVEELKQVAGHPGQEEGEDVEGERESSPATESLAVAPLSQLQRHRWTDGGAEHPLHHLNNLIAHLLGARKLRVGLVAPLLIGDLTTGVVIIEDWPRGREQEEGFQEAQPEPGRDEASSEGAASNGEIDQNCW